MVSLIASTGEPFIKLSHSQVHRTYLCVGGKVRNLTGYISSCRNLRYSTSQGKGYLCHSQYIFLKLKASFICFLKKLVYSLSLGIYKHEIS
jgi:hypothetical protein